MDEAVLGTSASNRLLGSLSVGPPHVGKSSQQAPYGLWNSSCELQTPTWFSPLLNHWSWWLHCGVSGTGSNESIIASAQKEKLSNITLFPLLVSSSLPCLHIMPPLTRPSEAPETESGSAILGG